MRSRSSWPTWPRSVTCWSCAARSVAGSSGTRVRRPLCLVAGTGVVPAVAMSRAARHLGRTDLLHVVAVGRGHDELPYADELGRYGARSRSRARRRTADPLARRPPRRSSRWWPAWRSRSSAARRGSSSSRRPSCWRAGSSRPRSGSSSSARRADVSRRHARTAPSRRTCAGAGGPRRRAWAARSRRRAG